MSEEPHDDDVRRLLAQARHTEPMPADVAARLDAVLRDLTHAGDGLAPVVALPRRRRPAAALMAAAAAIMVGGVMFASFEHHGRGADSTAGAAGAPAERGGDTSGVTGSDNAGGAASESPSATATSPSNAPQAGTGAGSVPVRVRARHFTSDVRHARATLDSAAATQSLHLDSAACRARAPGAGIRLPASYDGRKAVLVYRSPAGGSQVVDLYLCGERSPARTTTLPGVP